MNEIWTQLQSFLTAERLLELVRALILLTAGWVIARLLAAVVSRLTKDRLEPSQSVLLRRAAYYGVFILFAMTFAVRRFTKRLD